jgi:hypothetical protein
VGVAVAAQRRPGARDRREPAPASTSAPAGRPGPRQRDGAGDHPAGDACYDITGFGSATFSTVPDTNLPGRPQPVVSAANVGGDTSASWIRCDVHVPGAAVSGYPATIVHSVS